MRGKRTKIIAMGLCLILTISSTMALAEGKESLPNESADEIHGIFLNDGDYVEIVGEYDEQLILDLTSWNLTNENILKRIHFDPVRRPKEMKYEYCGLYLDGENLNIVIQIRFPESDRLRANSLMAAEQKSYSDFSINLYNTELNNDLYTVRFEQVKYTETEIH